MQKFKIELATLAFLTIALFATNPTKDEYLSWMGQNLSQNGHGGGEALLFSVIGSPLVSAVTQREDFALFSVYRTAIDDETSQAILGIFHHFIPLPSPRPTWVPGSRYVSSPHVIAAQEKDKWHPEDGYAWLVPPPNSGDFRVQWTPGLQSSLHPHLIAADQEMRWIPEDGYIWLTNPPPPGDFRVRWLGNKPSSLHAHVVTDEREGRWLPEKGYTWIANPPVSGDFRTERISNISIEALPVRVRHPDENLHIAPTLPFYHGSPIRRCTDVEIQTNKRGDARCWFNGSSGIYVSGPRGSSSASTYNKWPNIDSEEDAKDN